MVIFEQSQETLESKRQWMRRRHKEVLAESLWTDVEIDAKINSKMDVRASNIYPIVRATSIISAPAPELFNYLVHRLPHTCHEWNEAMYFATVLHRYNEWAQIGAVLSNGKPLADREDIFLQVFDQTEDGTLYEYATGVEELHVPPREEARRRTVRSRMYFCSKQMIPISQERCEYTTVWHYDPAGWASILIPKRIFANLILKNLVHEHQKIRHHFSSL